MGIGTSIDVAFGSIFCLWLQLKAMKQPEFYLVDISTQYMDVNDDINILSSFPMV